jgi:hypothetical protein
VFHMDIAIVDRGVSYVTMAIHVCCKCLLQMFHLLCKTYVTSMFILEVTYV